ncbi:MarR family winged helix-turn-helix transcriptional regulator [Ilumatobacter coccineus]|uniref:Putative MarR family transcriptional regulator n=1 Tax=Ilumatobacter coccineus (strain NBRC 103263 / KCTC 29153 / YM16-304) TaxID=1313172 RepID=A0A6C7DTS9_ILUCY|nr:MarR family transcriptional regulator [Ilumatobacter coccineus]BAN00384.1 putative MarR family transcriptional regulator [Ilumatobacter coccineus YM16-304]
MSKQRKVESDSSPEPSSSPELDVVDRIVAQWHRERPDIDVSGMEIIGRLGRLERVIRPKLDKVFAEHVLESWEFDVLATLLRNGAPHQLTPGQLLDSMMITSGAMTNRLDRLEARGLVKRSKSEHDGRQVVVTLTKKGLRKVDDALADHAANELEILSSLDADDQAALVTLLRKLSLDLAAS